MNWKIKSLIQNIVSTLPDSLSHKVYYQIQRNLGGLRKVNPTSRIIAGINICKKIHEFSEVVKNKIFFEIGTGRRLNVPLVFYLLGAKKVITIDSNNYLKTELVKEDIQYMKDNYKEVVLLFQGMQLDLNRLKNLLKFSSGNSDVHDIMKFCNIEYIAPGDASKTNLPDASVDFHISYTVFEHIPLEIITNILREGNRIISNNGLFIHKIDFSDHFSHSDNSISPINFLQYNYKEWNKYAGNRYMYMNRLRLDDFKELYKKQGHELLNIETNQDDSIMQVLNDPSFSIDSGFKDKQTDVLCTKDAWIISKKIS